MRVFAEEAFFKEDLEKRAFPRKGNEK